MKTYKREDLQQMRVPDIKVLVRKHNLHQNYIKQYSRLRKADLIEKFLEHYKKSPIKSDPDQVPSPQKPPPPTDANAGYRHKTQPNPSVKKGKAPSKAKKFKIDTALGLHRPLFKEGVQPGAQKQFERGYGKLDDNEDVRALREVKRHMDAQKGTGKRIRKKKVQNPDFEYGSTKKQTKPKPKPKPKPKRKRKAPSKMNL